MEEQIINIIKNRKSGFSLQQIKDILHASTISNEDIHEILEKLCTEGKLIYDGINEMYIPINKDYKVGEILCTSKGHRFFIDENNNRIDIDDKNLNGALTYSKVLITKQDHDYVVKKVLSHKYNKLVCEVQAHDDNKHLFPLDTPDYYKVRISNKEMKRLADGDRILVSVGTDFEDNYLDGSLEKVICHRNEPNKDLVSIAYSKDFIPEFREESLRELENIDDFVHENELIGRVDLRNEEIFTIDGVDTKDMDDAISLREIDNGNYLLGVHIADVAHYVKPGMHLFEDAKERATSLYMIDSVIPMLPGKLSNGICSLNPDVERLTKSCIMEIDPHGNIVDSKIVKSVIRSRKKMDYDSINLILEKGIIPDGYQEYYDTLKKMQKLSEILINKKRNKGKIDFASNEINTKMDANGKPVSFNIQHQGAGEKLIEIFMVTANETVASYFPQLPFVYRVHGIPNEIKLGETIHFLTSLGYRLNMIENASSPKLIQSILNSLSDEPEFDLLSNQLLKSMRKAEYSINNIGHFGLASEEYTHFTSPIRRFPDLQVHTLIDLYFDQFSNVDFNKLENELKDICAHSSYKERQADAAELESQKLMMVMFMQERIGEEIPGIVISNDERNVQIRTDELVYGKVLYDPTKTYSTKKYKLGTKVLLKVEDVSLTERTVYFSIIKRLDIENTKSKQKTLQKNS